MMPAFWRTFRGNPGAKKDRLRKPLTAQHGQPNERQCGVRGVRPALRQLSCRRGLYDGPVPATIGYWRAFAKSNGSSELVTGGGQAGQFGYAAINTRLQRGQHVGISDVTARRAVKRFEAERAV